MIKEVLPESVDYFLHEENSEDYVNSILKSGRRYQIAVIDGLYRNKCTEKVIDGLDDTGVVIFDDSQLEKHEIGLKTLKNNGFKQLDFHGLAPIVSYSKSTSILYRSKNCFDI
jgi:hypothetical protein